jgi:hypothetical protein
MQRVEEYYQQCNNLQARIGDKIIEKQMPAQAMPQYQMQNQNYFP